jgi:ribose transport system substrate-binding protein
MVKKISAILLTVLMCVSFGFAADAPKRAVTIGFANMADSIEFCMLVKKGLEAETAKRGWKFIAYDNALDGQKAVQNTDLLIEQKVDYVVMFNIDASTQPVIAEKLKDAKIPALAIDIYLPGFPFFGVNNAVAGEMGGQYIGKYAQKKWSKAPDLYVILDNPTGGQYAKDRSDACVRGLLKVFPNFPSKNIVRVDAKSDILPAKQVMTDVLTSRPDAKDIAVTGINDQVCNGGLAALEEAGRANDALVVSLGADSSFLQQFKATKGKSAWKAAVLFGPERYGEQILPLVEQVLKGGTLPAETNVKHVVIDEASMKTYYPAYAW